MPKEEKGYWFSTENGTHIHAEEGESKESAMKKKFTKFGKKEDDEVIDLDNKSVDITKEAERFASKVKQKEGEDFEDFEGRVWSEIHNQYSDMLDNDAIEEISNDLAKKFYKKEQPKPSLKERRKEWEKNLSKSGDEYQKRTGELYQKLRNGEISRKQYNQEFKKIQEDYQKANAFPQRDRLAVDDEIDGYEKQFKSIKEQLDPLEDEDNRAFNRHLMFNEPYDESKKNPKIDELNTQLKDVMGKRTDARRRLAKELGSQFGRKDYRNEIDSGKLPSGNDRVYALYQKSLEEPSLDFSRMIANDVSENVKQYPKKLEFEDDLYEISESGRAFDHYKKADGEWQHISTGTISALGKDLGRRLEEENLKSAEPKKQPYHFNNLGELNTAGYLGVYLREYNGDENKAAERMAQRFGTGKTGIKWYKESIKKFKENGLYDENYKLTEYTVGTNRETTTKDF